MARASYVEYKLAKTLWLNDLGAILIGLFFDFYLRASVLSRTELSEYSRSCLKNVVPRGGRVAF